MNSHHNSGEAHASAVEPAAGSISQPIASRLRGLFPHGPNVLAPALIFILLAMAICGAGYATYHLGEQHLKNDRLDDLHALSALKAEQITHWLDDRKSDAFLLAHQSVLAEHFARWIEHGQRNDTDHYILTSRLAAARQAHGYHNILLLDANAEPLLDTTSRQTSLSPQTKKIAQAAISRRQILHSDLYRDESEPGQPVRLDLAAPLSPIARDGKERVIGAIVFQIDPEHHLYPMVKSWPTSNPTMEALLVQREGDEVLFLSEVRDQSDNTLRMRRALSQSNLPAARAAQGKSGRFEGVDYRGVPVLAWLSAVPDTSWHLVAKIDQHEIAHPIRRVAFLSVGLSLLLLATAGILVSTWWLRQRTRYEQHQAALAQEKKLLTRHLDYLSKYTNDIILLIDDSKRIVMANDTALKAYGYSEQELIGMDLGSLRTTEGGVSLANDYAQTMQQGQAIFETRHLRKDGSSFPVEVSNRLIEAEGRPVIQSIIRDITERKAYEKSLQDQMAEIEKSRLEWECVFDGVSQPIFLHDHELRIVRANLAYARCADMPFQEIIGKPYWQVFPKLDTPLSDCPDFHPSEAEIRLDSGKVFISRNYPITDKDGIHRIAAHVMEDITEREHTLEEIRLKGHLLDSSTDSIFVADFDGKLLYINETAWKTRGYQREELMSMQLQSLDIPEYAQLVQERFKLLEEQGEAVFESAHVCKNGSVMPVEVNARIVEIDKQKLVLGSVRDITERKEAERRRYKEAERTSMLLELHMQAPQWTAQEIYSYALEKSVSLTDSTIGYLHGLNDDQETLSLITWNREALKFCQAAHETHYPLSSAGVWADCIRHRRPVIHNDYPSLPDKKDLPEGHVPLLRHLSLPVILGDRIKLVIGVGNKKTDYDENDVAQLQLVANELIKIMARKQAEENLAASEERYRSLMDSTTDYLYRVQLEEGRVVKTSHGPGCLKITGYSPEDFTAEPDLWLRMIHPDDLSAVSSLIEKTHAGELTESLEHRIRHKDGSLRWISTTLVVRKGDKGQVEAYDGCVSDITARKQAELDLERLNRTLKTLSAGNMALVHATDETEVLEQMCRIIVETGGYRLAWVGFAQDDPDKTICPIAHHGVEQGYLDTLPLSWDGAEDNHDPTCTAIRSGKTVAFQDHLNEPRFAPWRDAAQQRGYAASISLPLKNGERTFGALNIYAAEANAFTPPEIKLLEEMAGDLAFGITSLRTRMERDHIAAENQQHLTRLRASLEEAIQAIAATVEMRDPYTAGHQRRAAGLAVAIARELGLDEEQIYGLHLAGIVHDLGKIHIPAEILSKPGRLTDIEFMLIKTHPQAGYDILKSIAFPWPIASIVWQHHERHDGSGYPNGLKGEQIIIEARILAVADVVEAMASHRPYRPGLGIETALDEIEKHSGKFYDPNVAAACLRLFREKGYTLG